ncbi:MAG: ion channel [Sporichthyaceae bacterium]|nr:ion channel [Sporichthyaceae bacterium]
MTQQADISPARRQHRWPSQVAALVLSLLCYYLVPVRAGEATGVGYVGFILGLTALTWLVVREIRRMIDNPGGLDAFGLGPLLFAVYLAMVLFAATYYRMADYPGQMAGLSTRTDALYYTLVTLTTTGFGDIHPVGQAARIVTMVQLVFDLVIIGAAATVITGHVKQRAVHRRLSDNGAPAGGHYS